MEQISEATFVPTVLVTGAARRLGRALVKAFHGRGYNVIIHYQQSVEEALALLGQFNGARPGSALAVVADLTDPKAPGLLVEATIRHFGRLDVLVNNAAVFPETPLAQLTRTTFDEILSINLAAPFFLGQVAAPYLSLTTGCIVNLVDIHGLRPLKGYAVYSIAKAGLIMATQALAKELGPRVRVNAVAPGAILWSEAGGGPEEQEEILRKVVLQRRGGEEDIVNAVLYLVESGGYVTGQILAVDGGRLLYS